MPLEGDWAERIRFVAPNTPKHLFPERLGTLCSNDAQALVDNLWQKEKRTPKAWKRSFGVRYFEKGLLECDGNRYPDGAWVDFPISTAPYLWEVLEVWDEVMNRQM